MASVNGAEVSRGEEKIRNRGPTERVGYFWIADMPRRAYRELRRKEAMSGGWIGFAILAAEGRVK